MSKKKPPSKIYVVVDKHGNPLETEAPWLRKGTAFAVAGALTTKYEQSFGVATYSLVEPRKAKS